MSMRTALRQIVFDSTDGVCSYCCLPLLDDDVAQWGRDQSRMEMDHKTPRARPGGSDRLENLAPACSFCNGQKNNKTVAEYRVYLLSKGVVPRFLGDVSPDRDWLLIATRGRSTAPRNHPHAWQPQ